MTIMELSRRVELHFWDWIIPTLCASPALQAGLRIAYQFKCKARPYQRYFMRAGLAALGFSNGIFVYWLVAR